MQSGLAVVLNQRSQTELVLGGPGKGNVELHHQENTKHGYYPSAMTPRVRL